jgi:hypothetical protein
MSQPATDEIATGDTPEHTREEAGLPDVSELLRRAHIPLHIIVVVVHLEKEEETTTTTTEG